MNRTRVWLPKVLLSTASLLLVLATAEGIVRLFMPPPQTIEILDSGVAHRLLSENLKPLEVSIQRRHRGATWGGKTLYVATRTGARLRANTTAVVRNHRLSGLDTLIQTNSLGYRNSEIGLKTRRRVLFLGDSITFGDWLPEEQTFVRRVEALSGDGPLSFETVNAGVGAIGLETELAILLETGLSIEPDIVVLGFYLNDAEPSRGVHLSPVPELLEPSWLARYAWRTFALAVAERGDRDAQETQNREERSWREKQAELARQQALWNAEIRADFPPGAGSPTTEPAAFNRLIGKSSDSWGRAWSASSWARIEPLLRELSRQAEIHDFKLLIVGFPVRLQVEADFLYDFPQQQLREIADTIDVPLLDLLPVLRRVHRSTEESLFYDQCHHTAFGNERVAEAVLQFVRAEVPATGG